MNRRPAIGRGDLVRALRGAERERFSSVAAWFGFIPGDGIRRAAQPEIPKERKARRRLDSQGAPPQPEAEPVEEFRQRYLVPVTFQRFDPRSLRRGSDYFKERFTDDELEAKEAGMPKAPPLAPWSRVWPWMRHALGRRVAGRRVDLRRLVALICSAKPLKAIPRMTHPAWAPRACIWTDRRNALAPFWDDFDEAVERIVRLRGAEGLRIGLLGDSGVKPESGTPVLVLGDLGRCSEDDGLLNEWLSVGRRLRRHGNRLSALLPCPRSRWDGELALLWQCGCWNRRSRLPRQGQRAGFPEDEAEAARHAARLDRLLALLSPAVRVEPGLLRLLARICGGGAALEFDAWNHPEAARSPLAMALYPEAALRRREVFSRESRWVKKTVMEWLEAFHHGCAPTVLVRELDNLAACGAPVPPERRAEAEVWRRKANGTMFEMARRDVDADSDSSGLFGWAQREVARASEGERAEVEEIRVAWALARHAERDLRRIAAVPKGIDPRSVDWVRDELERAPATETDWRLSRQGRKIILSRGIAGLEEDSLKIGLHLGAARALRQRFVVRTRDAESHTNRIEIARPAEVEAVGTKSAPEFLSVSSDCGELILRSCERPQWAAEFGQDRFGLYADAEAGSVVFRLRWIPPGRFWMGSPDDEKGRESREGPRHEVSISRGFWLAETPCTQALWRAVVGDNASHFKRDDSALRPVESVDWHQCMKFCDQLRKLDPAFGDIEFRLPTESEWEYACRACTESAFNDGSDCTVPGGKDPRLDRLGWHGEGSEGETHPVKRKAPNAWGLYDMHGNVWEWCLDGTRKYKEEFEVDPLGPIDSGALRALRGGSYWDDAWYCRSALRSGGDPGIRDRFFGFRFAAGELPRSGERDPSGASGKRSDGGAEPESEGRGLRTKIIGVGLDFGAVPDTPIARAAWASDSGYDDFGQFSVFQIKGVLFRLRWIKPGSFLMGSPEDENGRESNEGPQHNVTISRGFWLGETPCAQAQWEAVMGSNPSHFKGPDRPVEQVSWHDCTEFLSKANRLISGLDLRFPSEAEWEYACRAGKQSAFNDGSECRNPVGKDEALEQLGWYDENSGNKTHPVGQKRANKLGLYDMHGNVWEWCLDGMRKYDSSDQSDPVGATDSGALRALRGGGSWDLARFCRSALRLEFDPGFRLRNIGFRFAAGQPPRSGERNPSGARQGRSEG